MDDAAWLRSVRAHAPGWDLVKTTIGLSRYRLSGYEVARALVDRGIVIEKAGVQTITLIATFQLRRGGRAGHGGGARGRARPGRCSRAARARADDRRTRSRAIDDRPVMHPYWARRYAKSIGHELPLREAIGKVAAEDVEVYPPGIPVILEGFRVSRGRGRVPARGAGQGRLDRGAGHVAADVAGVVAALGGWGRIHAPSGANRTCNRSGNGPRQSSRPASPGARCRFSRRSRALNIAGIWTSRLMYRPKHA